MEKVKKEGQENLPVRDKGITDFFKWIGHPVAYYPSLTKLTGSASATILLCQLLY